MLSDTTYCHKDPEVARERAAKYLAKSFDMVIDHYEMGGTHFETTKGYEAYVPAANAIREFGTAEASKGYVATQLWGTPNQIIEKFRARVDTIGPYTPAFQFSPGGLPNEYAMESAALFAREVIPVIKEILEEEKAMQEGKAPVTA